MKRAFTSVLALCFSAAATAQEGGDSDQMHRALVAGYKAAFTCSAMWNAGQTLREIELNELSGIYPEYTETLAELPPVTIDDEAKTIAVDYAPGMPPRIAVWRPGFGCTQLPIGADKSAAGWLHRFGGWPEPPRSDRSTAIGSNVTLTTNTVALDRMEAPVSFAFDGMTYGEGTRTSAVVVVQNGQTIAEQYDRGINAETPQRTWSVAKSLTATIIGAADHRGIVDLDYPAVVSAWTEGGDPRREITMRNLLHMASGLDSGEAGNRTDRIYFGGARVIDQAVNRSLEAKPGARWKYANNDTLLALRGLREAIGDDPAYHRFPYEQLLWKIGANRTTIEADWNGDYIGSSQVWTTARDLARLGQLYLQDGVWGGERILAEGWVDFVRTPAPDQPERTGGRFGYGAQFWLMDRSPGVPNDAFAALGNRGQAIVIIPSREMVIVRRGYDIGGGARFDIAGFTRDVVTAYEAAMAADAARLEAARAAERGEDD